MKPSNPTDEFTDYYDWVYTAYMAAMALILVAGLIVCITPDPVTASTPTPPAAQPGQMIAAAGMPFGWPNQVQCYNCSPFSAKVRVTHYNPQKGDINCWLWSEDFNWCMSNTFSGIPWESVWGYGAACPFEWPIGTWVEIPNVGAYVCFDRGDQVLCDSKTGICGVDLLGPGGADWDGKQYDVTLWVPLKPRTRK